LGIELQEIEDWNCCGASSAHSTNKALSLLLPARNLAIAEKSGNNDLLVPCAACYNRSKVAHKFYEENDSLTRTVAYSGNITIMHVNEFFAQEELLERLKKHVVQPLNKLKLVPYYGCLTVRHPKVIENPDPEDPKELDTILDVLGAEPMPWSYKTDCCGGSLMMARTDIVRKLTGDLFEAALDAGAEAIVTDCPLCQSNLDTREDEVGREKGMNYNLPIFYITELLGLTLGCNDAAQWWRGHLIDPRTILRAKGLNGQGKKHG
jgi:heterodisulfide reductase subunit B